MAQGNKFDWMPLYEEFSNKLLEYRDKDKHPELIKKFQEILDSVPKKTRKRNTAKTTEKMLSYGDIDPFTTFVLFNRTNMGALREEFISRLSGTFNLSKTAPIRSKLDGISTLDVRRQAPVFFHEVGEIDDLWKLYECALRLADSPEPKEERLIREFSECYATVISNGGNLCTPKRITKVLSWARPNYFLCMDNNDTEHLQKLDIPKKIKTLAVKIKEKKAQSAEDYLKVRDACETELKKNNTDIVTFTSEAYFAAKNTESSGEDEDDQSGDNARYWIYAPGERAADWEEFRKAGIMAIGWDDLGNLSDFKTKKEIDSWFKNHAGGRHINNSKALWDFVHTVKPGDVVYAKKGSKQLVGRGIVESDYEFSSERQTNKNIRRVKWTHNGEWDYSLSDEFARKTLTEVTKSSRIIELENIFKPEDSDSYSKEDFLKEVFMEDDAYEKLINILKYKKNVILQGPPGVGKTFAANRLAWSMMEKKDLTRVKNIQFHQSYSYEDFMEGYRPTETGFELRPGVFKEFCDYVIKQKDDRPYFFIIDEINRGNLSKIFGEVFMLIEGDKRGSDNQIQLLYGDGDNSFYIPENLYIIGTMNTADRSLAMLDYALRRRFAFYDMRPAFDSDTFAEYVKSLKNERFSTLIERVKQLNECITKDESLGKGFCIGHSYFCDLKSVSEQDISRIIECEVGPLLEEYWFDESGTAEQQIKMLKKGL